VQARGTWPKRREEDKVGAVDRGLARWRSKRVGHELDTVQDLFCALADSWHSLSDSQGRYSLSDSRATNSQTRSPHRSPHVSLELGSEARQALAQYRGAASSPSREDLVSWRAAAEACFCCACASARSRCRARS
jgi:hypothetical protein